LSLCADWWEDELLSIKHEENMVDLPMQTNSETYLKMVKARAELVMDHPFFGSLALRLKLKEDPTCETTWSDGRILAFNPAYIELLPLPKVTGIQAHEVMHLACQHHTRRKGRDHKLWNVAGDYAINWLLLEAGFELPEGFLVDPAYKDKSVDEIYTVLIKQHEEEKSGGEGQDQGKGQEEDADQKQDRGLTEQGDSHDGSEEDEDEDQESLFGDPGKSGEVRDATAPDGRPASPADITNAEKDWRIALGHALAMGDLPAGLERLLGYVTNPRLDWKTILRRFIDASARDDYSWMPPNRRYVHMGLHLPSLRSQKLPEIVLAIDTSGSISENELEQFAAEVSAILEDYDTRINVVYCDAKVAGIETYERWDLPLQLNPKGGGGTDFRPPFQWVEEQGRQPACLIYLTDLECNRYPEEPVYPVLWAKIGNRGMTPPFGELIEIE